MLKKTCLFLCATLFAFNAIVAVETTSQAYVTQISNPSQFEEFIQKADKPVVIDFWANWCNPCMQMKPVFESLAKDLQNQYHFVSINIDNGSPIADKYNIQSIPAFIVIKDKSIVGKFAGQSTKEALKKNIESSVQR